MDLCETSALLDHALGVQDNHLRADGSVYGLANVEKQLRWITLCPNFGHEGRVRGHAIDQARLGGAADLFEVCRIEKDFHLFTFSVADEDVPGADGRAGYVTRRRKSAEGGAGGEVRRSLSRSSRRLCRSSKGRLPRAISTIVPTR